MNFSPDGLNLLGGVGNGRIYLNGVVPPALTNLHAGGWGWLNSTEIGGPGGFDGPAPGLYVYDLVTGGVRLSQPGFEANAFYGGSGWSGFLASNPFVSFDSCSDRWANRVVVERSNQGHQLFTFPSHSGLLLREADGHEVTWPTGVLGQVFCLRSRDAVLYSDTHKLRSRNYPDPWAPASEGMRFCIRPNDPYQTRFIAGYVAGFGLCFFQWQGATSGPCPGIVLSGDGRDFAPDIAWRTDGLIVIGSGVNQGETAQRLYELDLSAQHWRVNGGPWVTFVFVDLMGKP